MITKAERAAVERLAELAKISRTLDLQPVVAVPITEAAYEMACQSEAIRRGLEY